jgi:hypothetical protein
MSDRIDAVRCFMEARSKPTDESIAALDAAMTDGVTSGSADGPVPGKARILEACANPEMMPMFAQVNWTEPVEDGETVTVQAMMPPGGRSAGVNYIFSFDGGRISDIAQSLIPL